MKNNDKNQIALKGEKVLSKGGYLFCPDDEYWQLDKNTNIPVGSLRGLLVLSQHCYVESQSPYNAFYSLMVLTIGKEIYCTTNERRTY